MARRCKATGVPRFTAFNGVRFRETEALRDLTAPPYDVLDADDRASLLARHRHNIAHIDLPNGDYASAALTMRQWLGRARAGDAVTPATTVTPAATVTPATGGPGDNATPSTNTPLCIDDVPTLTRYTMTATDEDGRRHVTRGVIGALELMEPGTGDVLPHERTTPKDVTDRLELTRATQANLSPVWGLSMATGVGTVIANAPARSHHWWTDDDGVRHDVEVIADDTSLSAICTAIEAAPVVIADGHHRYQVSRTYAAQRQAIDGAGPWDLTMCFVVELSPEQLTVHAIHRLVAGLSDPVAQLSPWFEVVGQVDQWSSDVGVEHNALGLMMATDDRITLLRPRPEAFSGVADLDSARIALACERLGATITYHHSPRRLRDMVRGSQHVGILLRPVRVDQIVDLAAARGLMPPKSTFFSPKPRTGVVMRLLEHPSGH
jgi:uncharacterized protein (DUF1015 family)